MQILKDGIVKKRFNRIEDLWSICPELNNVMVGEGLPGRSGKIYKSQGTSTPNNLLVIANMILDYNWGHSLETGMAYGASTLAFLAAKRYANLDAGKHVVIDPFQRSHFDDCGVMAVERAKVADSMEVHYAYSSIELPRQVESAAAFNLIYVDGSHLFEDAFVDAYFAIRLLCEGGIVLFDDSTDRHVAKVVSFMRTNFRKSLRELDLSQWRGDQGQDWRYQVGRKLGRVQLTGFKKIGDSQREWNSPFVRF